jgi:hypothetical protein
MRDTLAKRLEPAVLLAIRVAAREDNGVILIERQKAFSAPGRAQDEERVCARRRACAALE